jgi:hypothetical protein
VSRRIAALALGVAAAGCSPRGTLYPPRLVAEHELVLRYDDGFELSAGGRTVARGHRWEGLTSFVGCAPRAQEQAREAEADGALARGLSVSGGVLAGAGLAGLGGIAFVKSNPPAMTAFFVSGAVVEVVALVLASVGRSFKVTADGHAIDAMNFYNDAVGSLGRRCGGAPAAR